MRKKILSAILIVLLVIFVVDRSDALGPAAIIPIAAVGSVLIAGATMTPQQKQDFYQDVRDGVTHIADTTSGIVRNVWQAEKMKNELGFDYLVGRGAQLYTDMRDFIDAAYGMAGSLSQWLQDLLSNNDEIPYPPEVGDTVTCTSGNYIGQIREVTAYTNWLSGNCSSMPPVGQCDAVGVYVYKVVHDTDTWCTQYQVGTGTQVQDDPTWPPPGGFPPDYPTIEQGIRDQIEYAPAIITDDYDEIIKRNPGIGKPIDPAAEDPATAPPIADIPPSEIQSPIDGTVPGEVPVVGEDNPTPDATLDNDLLRGIYNNTLATARNTASTVTAIQNLALTGEPTDVQPVVDAIVALPGQIVPPLVGPIEALPAQITNPIVDKLDEIKETIPPPIDSLELTGDQPALGDDNVYDTTIEEPEEESLSETILEFINNGLPFVSTLKQNAITLSNPSPSYDFVLYDHQFSFDFSPYESHLRAFGYLLYGLTVFSAFMIIVRR